MWADEHRKRYRREGGGFPSDLTGAERGVLGPLVPDATPGGRPRTTNMRSALNAILYLLRTGYPGVTCHGMATHRVRLSTTSPASPRQTAHGINLGSPLPLLREREGREGSPSAGIIDSRTTKSAGKGAQSPDLDPRRTRHGGL